MAAEWKSEKRKTRIGLVSSVYICIVQCTIHVCISFCPINWEWYACRTENNVENLSWGENIFINLIIPSLSLSRSCFSWLSLYIYLSDRNHKRLFMCWSESNFMIKLLFNLFELITNIFFYLFPTRACVSFVFLALVHRRFSASGISYSTLRMRHTACIYVITFSSLAAIVYD